MVSELQPEKAPLPIFLQTGKLTVVSELQPQKASLPILVHAGKLAVVK